MRFYLTFIISAMAIALACGSAPSMAAPTAEDGANKQPDLELDSAAWSRTAQEVLVNALSLTGIKYQYGGNSPETGFDCSGFVRYVFEQAANLTLPHGARALSQLGKVVPIDQLQPGDLVFFNTLKSAFSHVGIYLGDNRFIHAPSTGGGIRVVDMNDNYWASRFTGARRMDAPQIAASPKSAP